MNRCSKISFFVLLVVVSLIDGHAQSFYNTNTTVTVTENTVFSVKDSIVNNGTFINNGNLVIGGTWQNTGTYDAGQGEITFNNTSSSGPQVINHNNQSFNKLTISGGGTKLILADITVVGEMILEDGIIEAENDSKVIINADAVVSGGSDLSHIHAPVYHLGPGHKVFPIGDGERYLPVELLNIEGADAEVGVQSREASVPLMKSPGLTEISSIRFWEIDVLSGSINNSLVALPVLDESNMTNTDEIVVAQSPSLSENFESLGQSTFDGNASNGKVTSNLTLSAPFVTLATTTDDGSITVYNAVSPNDDGLNDFLRIQNIESYPDNTVSIFNRWGDKVFEIHGYDNKEKVFRGKRNIGGDIDLTAGTYFYVIRKGTDAAPVNGFISVKK